jgi:cytochrome c-type biogenesis protein CcmH/NrfF
LVGKSGWVVALAVVAFASLWGMPLMFLMARVAIWHSLRKRTVGEFVPAPLLGYNRGEQMPMPPS